MFTVFGLNGFLNFIHQPSPTNPLAQQFFMAVSASHFAAFFFALQLLAGLLLLSGFFCPSRRHSARLGALQHPCLPSDPSPRHSSGTGRLRALGAGLPPVPRKLP